MDFFYINEGWCSTLKKMCSPNLEALFINCKLFNSPREFSSFILVNVYVPPDACVSAAMQQLAEQISETEQRYPDYLLIILGDFNKANLSRELPKYGQHVTCPTRDSNILDHCYTIIKDAYHSVPRAALGLSDHCLVHLIPTYRQKFKTSKFVLSRKPGKTTRTQVRFFVFLELRNSRGHLCPACRNCSAAGVGHNAACPSSQDEVRVLHSLLNTFPHMLILSHLDFTSTRFFISSRVRHTSTRSSPSGFPCLPVSSPRLWKVHLPC